jgi:mannose-6-phosphate isomerase-like protein (cupin superfamily)
MRTFQGHGAEIDSVSDLGLARMRKLSLCDAIPLGTRRITVPPGGSGRADHHGELELSHVVSGTAAVEVARRIVEVDAGGAVLFEIGETHVFHNRSTVEPLVVFSVYWMPRSVTAAAPVHQAITA